MSCYHSSNYKKTMSIEDALEGLRILSAHSRGHSTYDSRKTPPPVIPVASPNTNQFVTHAGYCGFSSIPVGSESYMSREYYSYNTVNYLYRG